VERLVLKALDRCCRSSSHLALDLVLRCNVACFTYMELYPDRLHHDAPSWVKSRALFHIRIRVQLGERGLLDDNVISGAIIRAAKSYHERGKWWCRLFLLMPDHLHAILAFPVNASMSTTVGNWKRGTARLHGCKWQTNYFDHRIRNDRESSETWTYIRRNPVVKGLCAHERDWPWWWSGVAEN